MDCPETEQAAAYADGRLDAADAASFLEHVADCDECRRALAVLSLERPREEVPAAARDRVLRGMRRPSAGDRTPRPFRRAAVPRATRSAAGWIVAGAATFVALLAFSRAPERKPSPAETPAMVVREAVPPVPAPVPSIEMPSAPVVSSEAPPPPAPLEIPVPATRVADLPSPPPPAETPAPEPPRATAVEEPPRRATHVAAVRVLTDLQATDFTGSLVVRRKGGRDKERLTGAARLSEGDVVTAEKPSSFHVDGRHPVVLGENASISLAYAAQDQAPWLHLRSGEATIDSTGPTRWVVTDGRVAVVVKQARARFCASPGADALSIAALAEPVYLEPDGGRVTAVRPGEELRVARFGAEKRAVEAGSAARRLAAFEAARPRQRTIFYTSCDPSDAKREHFFVQEGTWFRGDSLQSKDKPDRTSAVVLAPNPRFAWRDDLVLRCRLMTNAQSVTVSLRSDERRYALLKPVAVERKHANAWVSVELPLGRDGMGFRRDDGLNQIVFTPLDRYDALRFQIRQQDVFGDQKGYLLVDDIQVFERE